MAAVHHHKQSLTADVKKESATVKGIITGGTVIAEMLMGGLFLENLKMQKQLLAQPYPTVARTMLRAGLGGFWAGFWPWGAALGVSKGIVLGSAKAFWQNVFLNHTNVSHDSIELYSGTLAGACQGIVMGPTLLARTRVNEGLRLRMEAGLESKGVMGEFGISMSILNDAIKRDGFKTLTIGLPTMVLKRSLDWGCRFFMMGIVKEQWRKAKSNPDEGLKAWERLVSTFIGSGSSVLILQPLDKLMPVIQADRGGKSVMDLLRVQIANKGYIQCFWGGTGIRLVHIGWHTSWAIFVAQEIYNSLYHKQGGGH
eukprot:429367_1